MDYSEMREWMVSTQLVPRGIRDKRVLAAMKRVPRHLFVDHSMANRAYDDSALPIGEGQTISQPYMVAVMTELLELTGNERCSRSGPGRDTRPPFLQNLQRKYSRSSGSPPLPRLRYNV